MSEDARMPTDITIPAEPPFTFGIGTAGELLVHFSLSGISAHLAIPAHEPETLQRGLEQSRTIRETLSAKRPPQGAH